MTQDCENYRELLAAHALTALDAADAGALEAHLESCADCRAELNAWEATTALLAFDAPPVEPSAQLRASILASVREDRDDREVRVTRDVGVSAAATVAHGSKPVSVVSRESGVLPFERPPTNIWASLRSIGAIAALFVCAVLLIVLLALWRQHRSLQAELAQVTSEMREAQTTLERERAIVKFLTSPDGRLAKLSGTDMAPSAHAMLAYDKNGRAMLMAAGLPAAPRGMAYQLWFIVGNKPMPGKVFKAEPSGEGMLNDNVPTEALNAAVFAVTLEPESGVKAPTGAIYLRSAG
jgi:anti-sigma-K factor RskA